jgi:murein DD-endopeptidase MepM/ murein hydrolase activator NlpD
MIPKKLNYRFLIALIVTFLFQINTSIAKENLTLDYNDIKVFLEGDFIQGGLVKGKTNKNISVKFKERLLRKTSKGFFVFGFGRDHPKVANLSIKINKKWISKNLYVKKRVYKTQIINGLEKKMVTPPKSFYERIIRENKAIKNVRNLDSDIDFIFQKFNWPAKGIISGVFGSQRILNGKPKRPHYGIDIAAKKGTSVLAPIESIVRMAEKDLYYTGGTIMLDHGHGVTSVYSHLSLINVNIGDKVKKGQKIGEIGSTGRSTGPHLDWRINWFLERLDPALLVP